MKLKVLFISLLISIFFTAASVSASDYKEVKINVNDTLLSVTGIIKDGSTLVPLRGVFEELGYEVEWDGDTKTAYLRGTTYSVYYTIQISSNDDYFICSTEEEFQGKTLYGKNKIVPDVPQQIIDGHFYLPLRAISKVIRVNVDWSADDNTAYIYTRKEITDEYFKSSVVDDYVESMDWVYLDQIDSFIKQDGYIYLKAEPDDLTDDFFDDIKKFSDAQLKVQVIGEKSEIADPEPLVKFFEENPDSSTVFTFHYVYSSHTINSQTIDVFMEMYEFEKNLADDILSGKKSDFDKVLAIHDYLVLNTAYDYTNYKKDTIPSDDYNGHYVLKNGIGVCEGYSEAAMILLAYAGIECEYVTGTANGVNSWGSHGWLIVKVDDSYYHLDVTFDDPVEMPSDYIRWDYFLKSDSVMSSDHKWEKSDYPTCSSSYNYK